MAFTDAQLLDFDGVAGRADSFRFEVWDVYGTQIGTLGETSRASAPSLSCDGTRTAKRQLDGLALSVSDTAAINTITDRIVPFMLLENGSEYQLGVFAFADDPRQRTSYGRTITGGRLTDMTVTIDQQLITTFSWPAGGISWLGTIYALLQDANILEWNGQLEDLAILALLISARIGQAVTYAAGSPRIAGIQAACTALGFQYFFDEFGVFTLRPQPDLDTAIPAFAFVEGGNIIAGSITESTELLSAFNIYVVLSSVTVGAAIYGSWQVPASAPFSVSSLGYAKPQVVTLPGIGTAGEAQVAAKALAEQAAQGYGWVTLSTPLDPRHGVFDVCSYDGNVYVETGWTMPLSAGGVMTHTLRRHYS